MSNHVRIEREDEAATHPARERFSRVADLICEQGWFGRKTGQGYYRYDQGRKTGINPGAAKIVTDERARLGITPKTFTGQEITDRILTAIIQEASMILQEGIALRPVDIDVVQLFGYGFPRHRGGPMHMADQIGVSEIIARIEAYAKDDAYFWQVPELLREMDATGKSFSDLNEAAS